MSKLHKLLNTTTAQGNPIEALRAFLDQENRMELAKQIDKMRFVGYVLELGFDAAKIITSDPYKLAVGGDPPPINESTPRVNLGRLWTFHGRFINGTEAFYIGADYRASAAG